MKKLNLKDLQNEELKILLKTTEYLDKHGLSYYLACGTLLGAIRHKGFIPWDDDIDITMPRPDYDKLLELAKKEDIAKNLRVTEFSLKNSRLPLAKVVNDETKINSLSKEDKNLWIDIFAIDGLPDDDKKTIKHYKKTLFHRGLIYLKTNSFKDIIGEHKSIVNRMIKIILKPIASLIPISFSSNRIIKLAKKYDFNKSKYVGVYIWGDGLCEKMEKKELASCKVEFEGKKFSTYKNYDKYLKNMFGDYMKLPPEADRRSHNVEAYK